MKSPRDICALYEEVDTNEKPLLTGMPSSKIETLSSNNTSFWFQRNSTEWLNQLLLENLCQITRKLAEKKECSHNAIQKLSLDEKGSLI
ncbi:hypothetical protein TNIN_32721 [Trichonephila inaurata madagascariensis]|uniref:Uncharacterized protein n=1 Tax=Trichonephila inaurata madagascariensis TaxID=2747483 RepID=A0A8X6IX73_9ARAC|nr:hypothetical protein TNIN_32721 [Trichonephila inaurata madagascariensis]